jgi:hypothetical protein
MVSVILRKKKGLYHYMNILSYSEWFPIFGAQYFEFGAENSGRRKPSTVFFNGRSGATIAEAVIRHL